MAQPAQCAPHIRRTGARADEVSNDYFIPVSLGVVAEKAREQGGLAGTRFTHNAEITIPVITLGVLAELVPYRHTAAEHKAFGTFLDERFHRRVLFREFIERLRRLAGKSISQLRIRFHAI